MVTRPAHQANQLIQLLEQAGASTICQPLIEIIPLANPSNAIESVKALPQTDIAIFISQNAVLHGINLIEKCTKLPDELKLATVGLGSATLLEQKSQRPVDIVPLNEYNSEGLLAHPELQDVAGKSIIIFRGIGGRNFLADTLRQRGAHVRYAEVYQRQSPTINLNKLDALIQQKPIDFLCITSAEGLNNLVTSLSTSDAPKTLRDSIFNSQLVIVNQRIVTGLKKYSFTKKAIITENVSDKAIVDAIIKDTIHTANNEGF